jgi:3-oxoacyl-[acyl-carrier protein] reductase
MKRIILITGGSRGLGRGFVERLSLSDDHIIYYTYSDPATQNEESAKVIPVLCDQRNEAEITDCVNKIKTEQGRIDVLVNNACPCFKPCDFLETDWAMFKDLIDVNVKGTFLFSREAAELMKSQGSGKIINILTSYVINVPPEKLSFYITAKYALLGLSKAMAVELCKYGITVNTISPGMMATRLTEYLPARYMEAYRLKHPMKKITTAEDVAGVLDFLISDSAGFLNGVNIPVNGGEAF